MTTIFILATPTASVTPWWRTDERLPETAGKTVWADCCCCKMPAEETECSYTSYFDYPHGGMGGEAWPSGRFEEFDFSTGAYYGGDWKIRCADGFGCKANPRRLRGKAMREYWRWAA